jgi:hypothetical protein
MNVRKIIITCAAALALVAGGTAAGAAIAQGPVSNGQVQGCYDSGGNLRVLLPGQTSCPKGWTALNWSQQGPAGPAGPQGPAGPPGGSNITRGTLLVTESAESTEPGFPGPVGPTTFTCSLQNVTGPAAGSVSVTAFSGEQGPTPLGCDISGLPANFTWTLTPVNDTCGYGLDGTFPPGGGPGTPCPDITSMNSSAGTSGSFLTRAIGDYSTSAATDLFINIPALTSAGWFAGTIQWTATPPAS